MAVPWEESSSCPALTRGRVVGFKALVTIIVSKAVQIVEKKCCRQIRKGTKITHPNKFRITAKVIVRSRLSGHCSTIDMKSVKAFLAFGCFLVRPHSLDTETARTPLCKRGNLSTTMIDDDLE